MNIGSVSSRVDSVAADAGVAKAVNVADNADAANVADNADALNAAGDVHVAGAAESADGARLVTEGSLSKAAETGAGAAEQPPARGRAYHSKATRRAYATITGLVVFMVLAATVSLMLGRFPIAPDQAFGMLASLVFPVEQTWTDQQESLFFNARLPRILLALMIGACLSAAGAAFQGTFQNPLVSPDILGASQGAAFGAALAILTVGGAAATSAFSFVFAMVTVLVVLLISNHAKGNRVLVVVLAGVMVSSLFQSAVSFCKLVADPADDLPAITYWLMGSLSGVTDLATVGRAAIPMAIGMAVLFALRWRINILTMGDDEASTMGINAKQTRYVVLLAATLVTAASVSVSGIIGFVGLVVPHLARMIVGSDYRKLIPASALLGASFLLVVDNVSRLATTAEIPIGILTAFIGAPFFLYLITRKKKL